jgi:peptide-methionine (S)-S-oxide reductase
MTEIATLAGGCFWCTEAVFQRLKGVTKVTSGYSGGETLNPSYDQVSSGATGHAEAVQIKFDPSIITFEDLLQVFFKLHDPTTLDRQGVDVGSQYRSAIFYHSEEQKAMAQKIKAKAQSEFKDKIMTEISKFIGFTPAENYHNNYYNQNRGAIYCKLVIDPKIKKLQKEFGGKVKN